MNAAFLLLTVATGGGPPSELELAKAAAAAELAKLSQIGRASCRERV